MSSVCQKHYIQFWIGFRLRLIPLSETKTMEILQRHREFACFHISREPPRTMTDAINDFSLESFLLDHATRSCKTRRHHHPHFLAGLQRFFCFYRKAHKIKFQTTTQEFFFFFLTFGKKKLKDGFSSYVPRPSKA